MLELFFTVICGVIYSLILLLVGVAIVTYGMQEYWKYKTKLARVDTLAAVMGFVSAVASVLQSYHKKEVK